MEQDSYDNPPLAPPIGAKPQFSKSTQRPPSIDPSNEDHSARLTPTKAQALGLDFKNRIYCTLWEIAGEDEIELKTIKVKPGKDTFTHKGREYNVIFSHRQWKKAAFGNRRLTLNYKINEPNPISYRAPSVYSDANLALEIHRRKSYRSLLNKLETIVLVMVIASIIGMVAAITLYIYGQVNNRQEIARIQAENNALKQDNAILKLQIENLSGGG